MYRDPTDIFISYLQRELWDQHTPQMPVTVINDRGVNLWSATGNKKTWTLYKNKSVYSINWNVCVLFYIGYHDIQKYVTIIKITQMNKRN